MNLYASQSQTDDVCAKQICERELRQLKLSCFVFSKVDL